MLTSQHYLTLPHSAQAIDENILSADALLASRQPLRAVPLYERALRDKGQARSAIVPGPMMQNNGVPDQQHRKHEMGDHERRVQFEQHREPAEQDLSDDPRHEAQREPGEVATTGRAHQ